MGNVTADKFHRAIELFDAANSADPNQELCDGVPQPKELVYARRMTAWLERLAAQASEPLRLAARCQHICRWTMARTSYPPGRRGYIQWRTALAKFHAEKAGAILSQVGYDEQTVTRVQDLVQKKGLPDDPQTQLLEDVICLVFLESYFAEFLKKHDQEKVVNVVRKTWKKMSPQARRMALGLSLPPGARTLIDRAVAE